MSVNDLNHRGRLLTSTAVLQAKFFLKTTDRLTVCQKGEDMWLEGLESMTSATFPKNRRQSATLLDLNLFSPFEIVF